MSSPAKNNTRKIKGFNDLLNNNKFVLLLSLVISFMIWVAVAMYASPEESLTIYNVPIVVNTENSLVAQKGYENFWQSDDKIDVTVTGPRYLITSLTPNDILVSANLNTVDKPGISELALKVSLKESSQDITISEQSKKAVQIYFDTRMEKEFEIMMEDTQIIPEKIAEGYSLDSVDLTVTKVMLTGPETEINKIISVTAAPELPEDLLFETATYPIKLSFEGTNTSETLAINEYVSIVDEQEHFVKISIDKLVQLAPEVVFIGDKTGETEVTFTIETLEAKIATESQYDSETLPVLLVDYADLKKTTNKFQINTSTLKLPEGVKLPEEEVQFEATIKLIPIAE